MTNTSAKSQLPKSNLVVDNPWRVLEAFTDARIGLGRVGGSLPTNEHLAFQLAHAQARDAVHLPLDVDRLIEQLQQPNRSDNAEPLVLDSQAVDRVTYLQRPDLGRRLHSSSQQAIQTFNQDYTSKSVDKQAFDLAIVLVDGLSSQAVQSHAAPFITQLKQALVEDSAKHNREWHLAPFTIVKQGRVAIGDEIGQLLGAKVVLVLIGERPGLSSPDSLGLYLTWGPKVGLTDAARNCISNIRPAGLDVTQAANRTMYLLQESRRRQISGVQLKDRTVNQQRVADTSSKPFLLREP